MKAADPDSDDRPPGKLVPLSIGVRRRRPGAAGGRGRPPVDPGRGGGPSSRPGGGGWAPVTPLLSRTTVDQVAPLAVSGEEKRPASVAGVGQRASELVGVQETGKATAELVAPPSPGHLPGSASAWICALSVASL